MFFTVDPNGHRHKSPIFTVCNATGIPMMVHAITKLAVKYPMAASRPPKIHHKMLPSIFIFPYLNLFNFTANIAKN